MLLADVLVDNIRKHGPEKGMDAAIPAFEQKMLSRSSRMVMGSREKAKEVRSPGNTTALAKKLQLTPS